MSAQTVVGIFNTAAEAQQAVQKLAQAERANCLVL
jgi:cell division protein FtsN